MTGEVVPFPPRPSARLPDAAVTLALLRDLLAELHAAATDPARVRLLVGEAMALLDGDAP
ncbi:hypothetical protein LPC08_01725 [Roseomonas sp. OT10]|uniref:hypothetical protein n=1 Tax=Roseomonas cutis TaxID=2897332 RepID=UPI001E2F6B24|nr:hypothetical protein [Roseomonas sp. OT10]UFN49391.1 hypothetical protein LPC08_01725 [Roseomonas sp. OT10]